MNSNQFESIKYKDINYRNKRKIDNNLKEQKDPNIYYKKRKTIRSKITSGKYNYKKSNSFNSLIPNYQTEVFNNSKNYIYTPMISLPQPDIDTIATIKNSSSLENDLQKLKMNYISLNNDNIILKEDINKLFELNKQLEQELEQERSNNYDLAKENDILNKENNNLLSKLDEVNQKITKIKDNYSNENEIMNKQMYLEEKINEKDFKCNQILEENNKINNEFNLLNDKYKELQEKHNEEEKQLNNLKKLQEDKLYNIENQLTMLIGEMDKLKYENNELKKENDNFKYNLINSEKEKNGYYNKYQEQKMKNDIINKEIVEIQRKYQEYKIELENKINEQNIRNKMNKNKSENKINVIKDLQKKIKQYKTERIKRQINYIEDEDN